MICAATVLCGELSLLAAQSNSGELMAAHHRFERGTEDYQESSESKETAK
jgi:hydroxymethylglutaryl-CoA reductase (NADPH)